MSRPVMGEVEADMVGCSIGDPRAVGHGRDVHVGGGGREAFPSGGRSG